MDVANYTENIEFIEINTPVRKFGDQSLKHWCPPPCGLSSFLLFYEAANEVREGIVTLVLWHFVGNPTFYITNQMWF